MNRMSGKLYIKQQMSQLLKKSVFLIKLTDNALYATPITRNT
eukprot:UN09711